MTTQVAKLIAAQMLDQMMSKARQRLENSEKTVKDAAQILLEAELAHDIAQRDFDATLLIYETCERSE